MEEKYYIDINENRKIIGRYLLSFHGENIPSTVQEVSQGVFETSIQENHNYLNEDLVTEMKELRNPIEIKQAKINEINSKAYLDITAVYPEWKQMNITRMKDYNEETLAEYDKMIAFIDEIRAYADYEVMMLD